MKIRRLKGVVLLIAVVMAGSGCQVFESGEEQQKQIETYEKEELSDGVYIQTGENYQTPNNKLIEDNQTATEPDDYRIAWWESSEDNLIPTCYSNSTLIFASKSLPLPESFTLEKFDELGYSVGIKYIDVVDGHMTLSENNIYEGSSADNEMGDIDGSVIIDSLNGEKISDSLISSSGTILGLKKDNTYKLGYYTGTYYNEKDIVADTRIIVSKKILPLNDLELTKDGYIKIKLPDNMEEGFYQIDNYGIFYYSFKKN